MLYASGVCDRRNNDPISTLWLGGDGAGIDLLAGDGAETTLIDAVPFICPDATDSRGVRSDSEPSIDSIDMLLPGRVIDDKAGRSRDPEKGGGGGGPREGACCALCWGWY